MKMMMSRKRLKDQELRRTFEESKKLARTAY
jgi:hypothetical protein